MTVTALSPQTADLTVGGLWVVSAHVLDVNGLPEVPVFEVTAPDGTVATPSPTAVSPGLHRLDVIVGQPGRYVAKVTGTAGMAGFTAYASELVTAAEMPDLDACKTYLGIDPGNTARDVEVQNALDAEAGAQRSKCRIPAAFPTDLREALLRRVARNLAMRLLPLGVLRGDGEAGDTRLSGTDPEIRRLEGPWRKVRMG